MFFDTKSVLLATLALLTATANAQSKFPFTVTRDANGAVTRIELPARTTALALEEEDSLSDLRLSLKDYQAHTFSESAVALDAVQPQSADDKKIFAQAKSLLQDQASLDAVSDPRLDKLFKDAKNELLGAHLYRLIAAPQNIDAFEKERAITEVVQEVVGRAGDILGTTAPALKVFEFLVDQYVDSLQSRRAFYQNQMLVLLDNTSGTLFTEKEKSAIRSSVYYSRLDFYELPARAKAQKDWNLYGDAELASAVKPCSGYVAAGETHFGSCFKQSGDQILNRMVVKAKFSKSVSLAYDSKSPNKVRNLRYALILAHLGVKLLPVPDLAKKPVYYWLNSQYQPQRDSEGFFYAHALLQGQTDLAGSILDSSANPLIRH